MVKNPTANAGDIRDVALIPGLGRSGAGDHGNPLQYSCLENLHGQSNLGDYSPEGQKELNMTEATWYTCNSIWVYYKSSIYSNIGENLSNFKFGLLQISLP